MGGGYEQQKTPELNYPNQLDISQHQIEQSSYVEVPVHYKEEDITHDLFHDIQEIIPGWFVGSAFLVGTITLVLIGIKITPLGKVVGNLFEMWGSLLKGKK